MINQDLGTSRAQLSPTELIEKIDVLTESIERRLGGLESKIEGISTKQKELEEKIGGIDVSVGLCFAVICFLIALSSKPSLEAHSSHFAGKLPGKTPLAKLMKQVLGTSFPVLKPEFIKYDNYYVFSVLKAEVGQDSLYLSFGIFNNIFDIGSASDIEEKFKKISLVYP